ncbi:MAG: ATP-binding cassette domain-containing protein [Roseovarius sp.]
MTQAAPILEAKHLDKFYGDFHTLNDVNLRVRQGEKMVICGPSGAGEARLICCFNGLELRDSGILTVDGIGVHEHAPGLRALCQHVGMVFQQFNLFPHLTMLENLMIGLLKVRGMSKELAEQTAQPYLELVHIPEIPSADVGRPAV